MSADDTAVAGVRGVEVDVSAEVPVLGFWGPEITVRVSGHAVKEVLP